MIAAENTLVRRAVNMSVDKKLNSQGSRNGRAKPSICDGGLDDFLIVAVEISHLFY